MEGTTATVTIQKSVTQSMGDGNFVKIQVGLTLPVNYTAADLKKVEAAFSVADEVVEEKLVELMEGLKV